jgi:hypothetical protein
MMLMIVEDVAAVAVIGLFFWLVPMRRNGIPGLRGRGRAPQGSAPMSVPQSSVPMSVRPRPVPADERISAAGDARVLAELGRTWDAGNADQAAPGARGHKNSA